jgi:hypothetical protein
MHDERTPYHIQVVLTPYSYSTYFGICGCDYSRPLFAYGLRDGMCMIPLVG